MTNTDAAQAVSAKKRKYTKPEAIFVPIDSFSAFDCPYIACGGLFALPPQTPEQEAESAALCSGKR